MFSIFLPSTDATYDIWVPRSINVYAATRYIAQLLGEKEQRYFLPTETVALYDGVSGNELRAERLIGELGFCNGMRLILV